jgi:hypothetical protein
MNWIAVVVLLAVLGLASPAFATPQLSGLGGLINKKKKPDQQQQQPQQQNQQDDQKKQDDKDKKDDKKQLFTDDSSASAKQKKDTTAMGFSGLNPDGTVENAVLNASPTADDQAAAAAMSQTHVAPTDLRQFVTDGKLKSKGGK